MTVSDEEIRQDLEDIREIPQELNKNYEGISDNQEETKKKSFDLFANQLASKPTWGPRQFQTGTHVKKASLAKVPETSAIFFKAGNLALLACIRATGNFAAQVHDHHKILDAFEQLPADEREKIAKKLTDVVCDAGLAEVASDVEHLSRSLKRKRSDSGPLASLTSGCTDLLMSEPPGSTTGFQDVSNESTVNSDMGHTLATTPSSIDYPATSSLMRVFPHILCDAINKFEATATADITMDFNVVLDVSNTRCLMDMGISPNRLQRVARVLFDIDLQKYVEKNEEIWEIWYENGSILRPNPQAELLAPSFNVFTDFVGSMVGLGVQDSPRRQDELKKSNTFTRCVTLVIPKHAHDVGRLRLDLEIGQGFLVKEHLFGSTGPGNL